MASQTDVKQVDTENDVTPKRRFDARDLGTIADYVIEEWTRRKGKLKEKHKLWADIDRQIAMEPERKHKKLPNGKLDEKKFWMAEMELQLQAQALEVLVADARRMMFPPSGLPFLAHAEMTDDYLERIDFKSLILGDRAEVPSGIDQDNVDKLTEGFVFHQMRQYDFADRMDLINGEGFKYGMGVGRGRMEAKNVYISEARGVRVERQRIPVLAPVSIKHLYLDDPMPSMHSAQVLGPAHIAEDYIRLEALAVAANKGSADPENEEGGWQPGGVKKLEANSDGYVHVLEMEGDVIVPRKSTPSFVIPGAIVTVAVGAKSGGKATRGLIRFRYRKMPFNSYVLFPYHKEHIDDPYPTSPLMKGRPMQIAAVDALNRLMDSAALKAQPPVGYSKEDVAFAKAGGPEIFPGAQWETSEEVTVHDKIGGDPAAMLRAFQVLYGAYAELSGILPARLGAQTVSHTTAFAKDAELQRGAVRTVDYVRQSQEGPLARWLDMSYRMGRRSLGSNETVSFYIDSYGGFVEIGKSDLPERAIFEWFGAGAPAEEQAKQQAKMASLATAAQMDEINKAGGNPAVLNIPAAIPEILRNGGWTDIDILIRREAEASGEPAPGAAAAALQQLGLQE